MKRKENKEEKPERKAKRNNQGKLRWRNVPLFFVRPLAEVGQMGEAKYGAYNFLLGRELNDYLDSMFRHIDSFQDPTRPDIDSESGKSELAHVAWNALAALYVLENYPEYDDRYKGVSKRNKSRK